MLSKKGSSSETCVSGMVKIGGAVSSSGCGTVIVFEVDPSQLPPTRFWTAYGSASTPMQPGSTVAQAGTEGDTDAEEKTTRPRVLEEDAAAAEAFARSALLPVFRIREWQNIVVVYIAFSFG